MLLLLLEEQIDDVIFSENIIADRHRR